MNIRLSISSRGGLAATHELHADGFDRWAIAAAVRRHDIVRARQGWYIEPGRHPALREAARVGGRLTCSSALRGLGVWVVDDGALHVSVAPNACQLRLPRGQSPVRVHWNGMPAEGSRLIVGAIDALRDLASCVSEELVGASAESIAHAHAELRPALRRYAAQAPSRVRAVLAAVDGQCESGTEFLFRWRMRRGGVHPRCQVRIAGVGRVDFLFGERLVVEVDGAEYHTDPEQFEADRRRDAELSTRGYRTLRFSYRQVMQRWPEVEWAVRAAIARGDQF